MPFTLHDTQSAPGAKNELEQSQKDFGFVPNLYKVMAVAPEALKAYKALHKHFQASSFNATELTIVWQTFNVYHDCHYCVPAHTGIAYGMKVDEAVIKALHAGETLQDPKLRALQETSRAIVDQRGQLTEDQIAAFKAAGYGDQQLLEIVLGLAQKVISNFTNHLADTPLDEAFKQFAE